MKIEFYHIDAFEVPNYEPIWRKLKEMGVDARMVGVPGAKNTAASGWFDFDRFHHYCAERAINYTQEADPTANLALTTQNADILSDYRCPRVRLMYGPILYPAAWGLQAHSVKPFDAVLTHGKAYQYGFSQWLKPEKLPIAGYPRYDDFFAGKIDRKAIHAQWGVNDKKPVLIFLPTWGDNTAFDSFFPELLHLSDRYQIILRPHHCTLRMEPQRIKLLQESGLRILDHAFDLSEIYAGADVILSDVRSGAVFEAAMCNVPTVGMVLDPTELSGWLRHYGIEKIIQLCCEPRQLENSIDTALSSREQSTEREQWADDFVAFRDGQAATCAAEALIQLATPRTTPTLTGAASRLKQCGQLLTPDIKTNLKNN